jgi:hypothetical protein
MTATMNNTMETSRNNNLKCLKFKWDMVQRDSSK